MRQLLGNGKGRESAGKGNCEVAIIAGFGNMKAMKMEVAVRLEGTDLTRWRGGSAQGR